MIIKTLLKFYVVNNSFYQLKDVFYKNLQFSTTTNNYLLYNFIENLLIKFSDENFWK